MNSYHFSIANRQNTHGSLDPRKVGMQRNTTACALIYTLKFYNIDFGLAQPQRRSARRNFSSLRDASTLE
jgi:hypothetical protein